jgi:hypothetical protein
MMAARAAVSERHGAAERAAQINRRV